MNYRISSGNESVGCLSSHCAGQVNYNRTKKKTNQTIEVHQSRKCRELPRKWSNWKSAKNKTDLGWLVSHLFCLNSQLIKFSCTGNDLPSQVPYHSNIATLPHQIITDVLLLISIFPELLAISTTLFKSFQFPQKPNLISFLIIIIINYTILILIHSFTWILPHCHIVANQIIFPDYPISRMIGNFDRGLDGEMK